MVSAAAIDPKGDGRRSDMIPAFGARSLFRLAVLFLPVVAPGAAAAQDWPTRTIRAIVPLTAGSAVDIVPRIVFEEVSKELGQTIVVDNRTGASGTIGTRAAATAAPDGYTLLAHSSALVISPFTVANAHYDALKDFAPVASLGNLPNVLVVAPSKNIHTAQELVAAAHARPITFGVVGFGTPIYLTTEKFRLDANFFADPIPFRGAPEALTEVMTGRVDFYYAPVSAALGFIRDGKLTALAVSSAQRSAALPDVPTSLEAGYPNSDFNFWIGVFAPAGTPRTIVERLNREIGKALEVPSVREKLAAQGVDPLKMDTAVFDRFVKDEVTSTAALAKALDLKPN
jgi:tripartite-type tricarboxylate transporter receptor subunit TctC